MHRREFLRHSALVSLAFAGGTKAFGAGTARRLRVAQIGTAHAHAAEKWATLRRLSDIFDTVALCEPDAAQRAKAEQEPEYAGARWVTEQEFFALPEIDAVLVEAELPDLLRLGQRVIERGWHLHLDKPAGRSWPDFVALDEAARKRGRVFQHGYMYRFHPAFQFCFSAAKQGWLGKIQAIHGEIGKVIGAARRPWLAENYGGSMLLLGCHLIDLTIALLGAPGRVSGYRRRSLPQQDAFSDHEVAVLEYPRALATIRSLLTEVAGDERRQFVVCGENATIEIMPLEPARLRVAFKRPPPGFARGYQDVALDPVDGRYAEQLREFARLVRGQAPRYPQFESSHDRLVQRVLLEACAP